MTMSDDRETVIAYLGNDEAVAFNKLVKKENLTRSEAVNYLIQRQLLNHLIEPEELIMNQELEERLEAVERDIRMEVEAKIRACEYMERLEENLAYVQEAVESLQKRLGSITL